MSNLIDSIDNNFPLKNTDKLISEIFSKSEQLYNKQTATLQTITLQTVTPIFKT